METGLKKKYKIKKNFMTNRKGILLAGGLGTRLFPLTKAISKQVLPIYDKPMFYYPLSNLIMMNIKEILIISSPQHMPLYKKMIGSGKDIGLKISYLIQKKPKGIAQSLILAEKFLNGSDMCLILGDNIFFGNKLDSLFLKSSESNRQSIFVKHVKNPNVYGVLRFKNKSPYRIYEKPKKFISSYAVTGVYFYNNQTIKYAKKLIPSARKELEITDLNQVLLDKKELDVVILKKSYSWHDAGNHEDYLNTSISVKNYEKNNNKIIGSIEIESFKRNFLNKKSFMKIFDKSNTYHQKISKIII